MALIRNVVLASLVLFSIALIYLASSLPGLPGARNAPTPPTEIATPHMATLPPPRIPTLPHCPLVERSNATTHGAPCKFIVVNSHMDNVELLYVTPGPKEEEKKYLVLDFNASVEMHSYTGDLWRMRSRHGQLLKEFETPVCGVWHLAHGRTPEVIVPRCRFGYGTEHAPAPLAPAASPAIRRGFTAERLRGCGSERVLSSEHLSPGMHLLCLHAFAALPPGAAFAAALFAHGTRGAPPAEPPSPTSVFLVPKGRFMSLEVLKSVGGGGGGGSSSGVSPAALIAYALAELERSRPPSPHQPAALFSLGGVRLESAESIAQAVKAQQGLLLFEGGQWLWPAARIGQEHTVHFPPLGGSHAEAPSVRLRVLSVRPRILEVDDFLTENECEHIIKLSRSHMFTSGVAMKAEDAKAGHRADEYRTSTQYSLSPSQTDELVALSRRVQLLTRLPIAHVEQIQVLRYLTNQHYAAHHDFFDPGDYGAGAGSYSKERGLASNRLATDFFYLNDVEVGGETAFPRAGGGEQPRDFRNCHQPGWLNVHPKRRRVVIFYSMLPSGEFDHYSLHAGCDVGENATKWAANFWIWNTPQQSTYLRPSLRGLEHDLAAPTAAEAAELTAELGVAEPPKKTRFDRF